MSGSDGNRRSVPCSKAAVHESGAITMLDPDGAPLDLDRRFTLDDDRDEMAHFMTEAGFPHLTGVFGPDEMAAVGTDIDDSIAAARDADPEYWWCTDAAGDQVAVRSLNFQEKSAAVGRCWPTNASPGWPTSPAMTMFPPRRARDS